MDSSKLSLTPEEEKMVKKQAFRSAYFGIGIIGPFIAAFLWGIIFIISGFFFDLTKIISPYVYTVLTVSVFIPMGYALFCGISVSRFNKSSKFSALIDKVNADINDYSPLMGLTPLVYVPSSATVRGGAAAAIGFLMSSTSYDNMKKIADIYGIKIVRFKKVYATTILILCCAVLIVCIPFTVAAASNRANSLKDVVSTMQALKDSAATNNRYFSSDDFEVLADRKPVLDYHDLSFKYGGDDYHLTLQSDEQYVDSEAYVKMTINSKKNIITYMEITYKFSEELTPEENFEKMNSYISEFHSIIMNARVETAKPEFQICFTPSDEFIQKYKDNLKSDSLKNLFTVDENNYVQYKYFFNEYGFNSSGTVPETDISVIYTDY